MFIFLIVLEGRWFDWRLLHVAMTTYMETMRPKCPKINTAGFHEWEVMFGYSLDTVSESHMQRLWALIPMHLEQRQIRLLWWYFPDCTIIKRNHTDFLYFLQPTNVCSKISSRKEPCHYSPWSPPENNTQCQKGNYHIYHKARTSGLTGLMIKFLEHLVINLSLEGF